MELFLVASSLKKFETPPTNRTKLIFVLLEHRNYSSVEPHPPSFTSLTNTPTHPPCTSVITRHAGLNLELSWFLLAISIFSYLLQFRLSLPPPPPEVSCHNCMSSLFVPPPADNPCDKPLSRRCPVVTKSCIWVMDESYYACGHYILPSVSFHDLPDLAPHFLSLVIFSICPRYLLTFPIPA